MITRPKCNCVTLFSNNFQSRFIQMIEQYSTKKSLFICSEKTDPKMMREIKINNILGVMQWTRGTFEHIFHGLHLKKELLTSFNASRRKWQKMIGLHLKDLLLGSNLKLVESVLFLMKFITQLWLDGIQSFKPLNDLSFNSNKGLFYVKLS